MPIFVPTPISPLHSQNQHQLPQEQIRAPDGLSALAKPLKPPLASAVVSEGVCQIGAGVLQGLLELTKPLGNVQKVCKVMDNSRDSYYR